LAGALTLLGVIIAVALSSGIAIVLTTLTHTLVATILVGMVF